MKKILIALLLLVSTSFAQSLMSVRYPTGTNFPLTTVAARMGGAGAGLDEPYLLSSINVGNIGAIRQSVYTLSINADFRRIIEGNNHVNMASFTPSFIGFAFPLGGLGTLAANFRQSGSNRFVFQERAELINTTTGFEDTINVLRRFDNHLAFSSWEFGWGIDVARRVSLGISYRLGQYQNHFVRSDVLETNAAMSGLDSINYNQISSAISAGFLVRAGNLGVGVSATYPFIGDLRSRRAVRDFTMREDGTFTDPIEQDRPTEFTNTYRLQLPPSGVIGASWTFNQRLRTALDFTMTFWDSYYWSNSPRLSFEEGQLQNALGVNAGVEFVPHPNLLSARFTQTIHYSGGLSVRQLPIEGDWETSISLGFGLPLGDMGMADISIETGLRRSSDLSDIRENFVRLNFGMSGGRAWRRSGTQF